MNISNNFIYFLLFFFLSCTAEKDTSATPRNHLISVPSNLGGEPNLFIAPTGLPYLTWVEYLDDSTDVLLLSKLVKDAWTQPDTIAIGTNWFVNWADFPSLVVSTQDSNHLAAHWLQKSDKGTYDYDVRIAQSYDGGQSWGPSFVIHTDGIPAEHGFATMLPLPDGQLFATWLDGRNTKTADGAMTIRTAVFDREGRLAEEAELDNRVCDCCQTDAALTPEGPIVVYRDRSAEEVRDMAIVRKIAGQWSSPKIIAKDHWKINGCPVNGPAIATKGQQVVVGWFSAPENQKQVKITFSLDGGATFNTPVQIDDGNPVGRVDVIWKDDHTAIISWLEEKENHGEIQMAQISIDGQILTKSTLIHTSTSRKSGFPIIEKQGDQLLLAWTKVDASQQTKVHSMLVPLD